MTVQEAVSLDVEGAARLVHLSDGGVLSANTVLDGNSTYGSSARVSY